MSWEKCNLIHFNCHDNYLFCCKSFRYMKSTNFTQEHSLCTLNKHDSHKSKSPEKAFNKLNMSTKMNKSWKICHKIVRHQSYQSQSYFLQDFRQELWLLRPTYEGYFPYQPQYLYDHKPTDCLRETTLFPLPNQRVF